MAAILSGARKYGLGLILAHQDLDQLARKDAELANSVISNPSTRICFRCGDKDAAKLESGFSGFDSTDIQSLGIGHAIARVGRKDHDFSLSFDLLQPVDEEIASSKQRSIVDQCRQMYAVGRDKIDALVGASLGIKKSEFEDEEDGSKQGSESQERVSADPIERDHSHSVGKALPSEQNLKSQVHSYVERELSRETRKEHRALQEYVRKVAIERNFKVVLEEPVNDGKGKVDVAMYHNELRIACEVSVSNTPEYEVGNIQKSLDAGFGLVFIISNHKSHLDSVRRLAVQKLVDSNLNLVHFCSQESFVSVFDLLLAKLLKAPETRTRGYRVKVNYRNNPSGNNQTNVIRDVLIKSHQRKHQTE